MTKAAKQRKVVHTRVCECEAWPFCEHAPNAKQQPAAHTPAQHTPDDASYTCGCQVVVSTKRAPIHFCPLHAQAPRMAEVLRRVLDYAKLGEEGRHEIEAALRDAGVTL